MVCMSLLIILKILMWLCYKMAILKAKRVGRKMLVDYSRTQTMHTSSLGTSAPATPPTPAHQKSSLRQSMACEISTQRSTSNCVKVTAL